MNPNNQTATSLTPLSPSSSPLLDLSSLSQTDVVESFVASEQEYISNIRVLLDTFLLRLRYHIQLGHTILTTEEIRSLFLNIENIHDFHQQMYNELLQIRKDYGNDGLLSSLGKVMGKFIPFFKLYAEYVKNHRESSKLMT